MITKPTYDQLEKRVKALEATAEKIKRAETACPKNEKSMQAILNAMGERVKELNCLYSISSLVEKHDSTLEEILQGTINIIPPSWQYPEITCARITLEGQEYRTDNFKETNWKQSSDIFVHGMRVGSLEVSYLKEKPEIDEGPFLKEERNLINAIAERLGKIIKRMRSERALQESEARYKILTEQVADGVVLVQEGSCLFANNAFAAMFGHDNIDRIAGTEAIDLVPKDFKQSFLDFHKVLEEDGFGERIFQGKYKKKNGQEFWAEAHLNKIRWNGAPAVLSTIRDITANKLKEIEIKKESEHLRQENIKLRSSIKERFRFGNIIGKSSSMQEVYELILKAGASDANVIIYGASGTGKELVAHALHKVSNNVDKKLVSVNCGAIPENLLESEFFGHVKGAFTGADTDAHGYLDLADGGTLFLDEIGELSIDLQVKLLQVTDKGCYSPVGSNRTRTSTFRIIAATNKDLVDLVNKGLMREDFFYRINVIPISLPPLRNRKEDIPLLIDHFMKKYGGNKPPSIPGEIMDAIYNYHWPGNIRQLQNVLHRFITLNKLEFIGASNANSIELEGVSKAIMDQKGQKLHAAIKDFERKLIVRTLHKNNWHKSQVASILDINRKTLFKKIKQHNIINPALTGAF